MSATTMSEAETRWLAERRNYVTATDAVVVFGLRGSVYSLWAQKRGLIPAPDLSGNQRVQWGRRLQGMVAQGYAEETGREVCEEPPFTLVVSQAVPFMAATPDARQYDADMHEGLLEIKTAGFERRPDWADEPPTAYQVQVQHQMAVTGDRYATIAVLIGGNELRWFDIPRNDAFINTLIDRSEAFYRHVVNGTPPPVDGTEDAARALAQLHPRDSGEAIVLPADAAAWDSELAAVKAKRKTLEELETELENRIKAAIGDATFGVLPDGGRWSWKTQERKEYTVKASSHRVLRRLKS